jgi:DNA-binding NtrC family response regulator
MSSRPCRVLIVDDDQDTREALSEALADAGFHVEQSSTAAEALRRIEESGDPDVILLDLRMPGMDGEQFLAKTQERSARVIVLTGDSSGRVLRFVRDARLMSKPVDLDDLEAAVKEACAA